MSQKKYVSLSKLQTFLENLNNKFAKISHKHTVSDITDYKVDSQLSSDSASPVQNKIIKAEFDAVATAMNALDVAIDGKANASHSHDDRYYTETEIDTKLSNKSDKTHNHDSAYDAKGAATTAANAALDSAKSYTNTSLGSYYTKSQIDSMELISVNDIDTICGSSIQSAREVLF